MQGADIGAATRAADALYAPVPFPRTGIMRRNFFDTRFLAGWARMQVFAGRRYRPPVARNAETPSVPTSVTAAHAPSTTGVRWCGLHSIHVVLSNGESFFPPAMGEGACLSAEGRHYPAAGRQRCGQEFLERTAKYR